MNHSRVKSWSIVLLFLASACSLGGYDGRDGEDLRARYHRVAAGETLYSIGKRYGLSADELALLNGIRDPASLVAGYRLLVGYGEGRRADDSPPKSTARVVRTRTFVPPRGGKLLWPVEGGNLISTFGPRDGSFHDGLDISAEEGTAVLAAHDGTVAYTGNDLGGYGNLLIVRGTDGLLTVYAHNRRLFVAPRTKVKRGQRIASVGQTGRATGPHLHFEVRMRDARGRYVAVDPLPLLQGGQLPGLRYRVNESLTPLLAKLGIW